MAVSDEEIERIIASVQITCAASGGCMICLNRGKTLSITVGDEEICFITQEEGADRDAIRQKIQASVQ